MHVQHKSFRHIRQLERERIEELLLENSTYREIARILGRDVSVISREVQRNKRNDGAYTAVYAEKKMLERRCAAKTPFRKIESDAELETIIITLLTGNDVLRGDWSPEVIANTVLKGKISHTTIYAWIKRSRPDVKKLLPFQGRRRARYGSVKTRIYREMSLPSIEDRPATVELRKEVGHFEGDTVVVRGGRVHTLVERKSRFLFGNLLTYTSVGLAMEVAENVETLLSTLPAQYRKTITYDQGSEFAWWDEMEKKLPGTKVYFAHAHSPWERGTNERNNGLMRRYMPKKKYSDTITHEDVTRTVWRLNHRPRKVLNWRTPCEVFGRCCSSNLN